jgi:hypothetical protein
MDKGVGVERVTFMHHCRTFHFKFGRLPIPGRNSEEGEYPSPAPPLLLRNETRRGWNISQYLSVLKILSSSNDTNSSYSFGLSTLTGWIDCISNMAVEEITNHKYPK